MPRRKVEVHQLSKEYRVTLNEKHAAYHVLSRRERDILLCIAQTCASNKEVGVILRLTEKTVKNYLSSIFFKLGCSSRLELLMRAVQEKFILSEPLFEAVPPSTLPVHKNQLSLF